MRIGLALGSGGARGLSHIAFLKVLDEMAVKPTIISGTSVGALIGAFYASGMEGGQIEEIFDDMGIRKMGKMFDLSIFSNSGLLKGKKVQDFLAENLPVRTFEKLSIPLKVVATDFWKRKEVVFEKGDLVSAIRASISIPVVMEPKVIGRRVFTDGGTVNPLPYDVIRKDCDILIAIDVSGERIPDKHDPMPSMVENVLSNIQIMQASIVRSKMENSKPDIFVQPHLRDIQILDFYRKEEILRKTKKDAERFRGELENLLKKGNR